MPPPTHLVYPGSNGKLIGGVMTPPYSIIPN